MSSDTNRIYDRYQRDPAAKAFYNSAAWKRARDLKAKTQPVCERCLLVVGDIVHHIKPLEDCTDAEKLAQSNLRHVCKACHAAEHAELRAGIASTFVRGQLRPVEDDEYRLDEHKSTTIERFALRFCKHWRGSLNGQPFALHPKQTEIIRPFYGLVDRETALRRFRYLWLESGVGSGKTPLMGICGLEHLLGGSEPGAQIYSIANSLGQARHSYDAAAIFTTKDPTLMRLVERGLLVVNKTEMIYKPTDSRWLVVSGKGKRAGAAASMLLVDEVHQIENRDLYDDLAGRMTKREQPITIFATNAAKQSKGLYADMREQAEHTLTGGKRANRSFFPVIWAAPQDANPADPASWHLANEMIGVTIKESDVAKEWATSEGSPELEARFRIQYLGQRVSETTRWLNMDRWDAATRQPWPAEALLAKMPRYLGIDWSLGDDLSALLYIYVTSERVYVRPRFWITKDKADHYRQRHDIRYDRWSDEGAITLVEKPTIDSTVQAEVAAMIVAEHKAQPFVKVCYDRNYSDHLIAALIAANVPTEGIGQGWGVYKGCETLANHLKSGTITIDPNPVLRFCAENVEIKPDGRGNYWPVKPGAKGTYAGRPAAKIDGISALVTALTVARTHDFPRKRRAAITAEAF